VVAPNTLPKIVGGAGLAAGSFDAEAMTSAFFVVALFLALVFFAGFFIPFFLRAGAARFALFDFAFTFFRFFAMIVLPLFDPPTQCPNDR